MNWSFSLASTMRHDLCFGRNYRYPQSSKCAPSTLEPWLRLDNKVVMVTGASSGIGRDFCLDSAKAGCRIIAAARRVDRLRSLCTEINKGPVIELSVQKAWDAFGRVDALINNAGERCHIINHGKSSTYQRSHN